MVVTEGSVVGEEWPATGVLLSRRYRLTELLATGGMSEIWRADDELLDRSVAIKLPRPQAARILHQAWAEARTTARLSHPHIAAVHDYGEVLRPDGTAAPYVVMELLDGGSLAARLAATGPLTWAAAARIGAEVASGLASAHARRVVHRDIKPGNIMLTPTGAKILDFGISASTGAPDDDETGATFGTPAYVAPERLDGTPAEPATDVYALGTVLFEMVSGEPPYPVDTWEEYAAARATPPGRLPDGQPAAFRELVDRCLAEDPRLRPAATEVRERLSALLAPERPAHPAGPVPIRRLTPTGRPFPAAVRVALVVLLLVSAGAAIGLGSWSTGGRDIARTPERSDPPPAAGPSAAEAPSAVPTTQAPSAVPTTSSAAPTPPGPPVTGPPGPADAPVGGLTEAVDSVISTVRAGQAAGQIRDDVAVDLINLVSQLDDGSPSDVGRRVAELQQKIRDRLNEGGLAKTYADELHNRLDRVATA